MPPSPSFPPSNPPLFGSPDPHGTPLQSADAEPDKRGLELKPTQLAGSALASVTSALAASYFGVTGTVVGAAFGSVVSSVAAAVYAMSLTRASHRLRTVVVAPAGARGGTGTSDPNDPTAVPGELTGARSPIVHDTLLRPGAGPAAGADGPPTEQPVDPDATRPWPVQPYPVQPYPVQPYPVQPHHRPPVRARTSTRRLAKPALVLGGFAFAVSIGAISATEPASPSATPSDSGQPSPADTGGGGQGSTGAPPTPSASAG